MAFFWTIGQEYKDMQTQNQHLLEQLMERGDHNIKISLLLQSIVANFCFVLNSILKTEPLKSKRRKSNWGRNGMGPLHPMKISLFVFLMEWNGLVIWFGLLEASWSFFCFITSMEACNSNGRTYVPLYDTLDTLISHLLKVHVLEEQKGNSMKLVDVNRTLIR